ncbi:hypothetical protein DERF_008582 [Dermatophagoides farinae]|uniref:Uncharacterized protein n=1 Tax=Dermatophagoides farinae TaxID=6954 RepID=A0A922L4X3_DERFA|nr:hypothetical protein DERF_008582 [Dermatophagoides farinae]
MYVSYGNVDSCMEKKEEKESALNFYRHHHHHHHYQLFGFLFGYSNHPVITIGVYNLSRVSIDGGLPHYQCNSCCHSDVYHHHHHQTRETVWLAGWMDG